MLVKLSIIDNFPKSGIRSIKRVPTSSLWRVYVLSISSLNLINYLRGRATRAFYLVGSDAELEGCVVGGKAGVPSFEVLAKSAVVDSDSHLKQQVCTVIA
jgi:hypothetical protein